VDHMEHNAMMQSCAKACSDCQRACDSCATHCARRSGDRLRDGLEPSSLAVGRNACERSRIPK
jgi:hypothetical protein